jgi:UDP-N-acetylmuramoyl-tripeptide--D-alanyl-D-alanine ligase
MNLFKIPKYQLYLFQLENYEIFRYLRLLFKKGFFQTKQPLRKNLVWTLKAKTFVAFAFLLQIAISLLVFYFLNKSDSTFNPQSLATSVFVFLLLFGVYFVFYILISLLLLPVDLVLKSFIVWRAKSKILNFKSQIKIVGIAGSFGKTTMKVALAEVLSAKYKVLSTPESVNTPVGVARWVLKDLSEETQILVLEMGEHYQGDVEELCKLAAPDISIITGVNEAHLERMGNMETVISTIFEIVSGTKPGGTVILNGDDQNVIGNYKKYIWPDHKVLQYQKSNIKNQNFTENIFGWEAESMELGSFKIRLLGEYALGVADAVIKVGLELGLSTEEIKKGLENIKPVAHRLQPTLSGGNVLVIDDAYNGNSEGVKEAIKTLSRFENRRKIYITPGLVETGAFTKEVHLEIGRQLAEVVDVVILIKNSVTPFIQVGINEANKLKSQSANKLIWFDTAQEAHAGLKDILKPGDVILFQNDWGDQYL